MPHRNSHVTRRRLGRLLFFSLVAWALVSLGRSARSAHESAPESDAAGPGWASSPAPSRPRRSPRRLAASFAFAVLFFAGASFSAVAGDRAVGLFDDAAVTHASEAAPADEEAVTEEPAAAEPAAEPAAPEEAAPEAAPAAEEEEVTPSRQGTEAAAAGRGAPSEPEAPAAAPETPAAAPDEAATAASQPEEAREGRSGHSRAPAGRTPKGKARAPQAAPKPVVEQPPQHSHGLDPEASAPGVDATIWINRALPDPTPASLRLSPEYASRLLRLSRRAGADWALVLGVLRAESGSVRAPGRTSTIADVARRLSGLGSESERWSGALAITGRTAMTDRAIALALYYRAVGIDALVNGLRGGQRALVKRILADERIDIYAGGRSDLRVGKIDVRVVALIAYLAEAHGQVTVSSLFSGHRLYARPGVVSAHIYGHAVDISALGGFPILGHQQPGSITEQAVRNILLLPAEMRPRQLISLIGMGGPSFPLANHDDHIHVGY